MNNLLKYVKVDWEKTVGSRLLLLEVKPYYAYKEGIKQKQEGLTFSVLSECMNYEKAEIKIAGILKPPFEFDDTPLPVEFEGLEGKLWQDWSNKGTVKLSLTAENIRLKDSKRIKIGDEK